MNAIVGSLFFVFGLVFGSFGNVLVHRIPRKMSISYPPSHCPACGEPISWRDNIPLLSWALLRGACRACGAAIPVRYPLVELASGSLFLAAFARFGLGVRSVLAAWFFFVLLVLSAIDLEHRKLPNVIVLPSIAIAAAVVVAGAASGARWLPLFEGGPVYEPFVAAFGASLTFLAFDGLAYVLFGRQGIGAGDIKLLFLMGLVLGYEVVVAGFLGVVAAAVVGAGVLAARKRRGSDDRYLPLGPFLAVGAVAATLWGPELVAAYLRLAGL